MTAIATRISTAAPVQTTTSSLFGAPVRAIEAVAARYRAAVDAQNMQAIDDRLLADAGIDPQAIGKTSESEQHSRLMMNLMSCR
jgi:hypothetical protein